MKLGQDLKKKKKSNFLQNAIIFKKKSFFPWLHLMPACSWVFCLSHLCTWCSDIPSPIPHLKGGYNSEFCPLLFFRSKHFPYKVGSTSMASIIIHQKTVPMQQTEIISFPYLPLLLFLLCCIRWYTAIHPVAEARNWESFHYCPLTPYLIHLSYIHSTF